ncbi:MAG: radical SAM protein, partial [Myxococcota bacterium]
MAADQKQFEIQLGHMCNNRCSFCVSGQRTGMGEARPLSAEPILPRIEEARAAGHRRVTLLGGEPTLQPAFLQVLRRCAELGFEEVVVFTNGVKTAREAFIDEALATGAPISWRISIQGATEQAHEGTTNKRGSWRRIVQTLRHLHARDQRITVNMCMVSSNLASVPAFAELLLHFGVHQLHLDTMRPMDAGIRSEEELAAITPRLADYAAPLEAMARAFDARAPGFDLNVGNVPYCVAPSLLHRIHHDGEHTETVAVDDADTLSQPWNKYLVKRRDKTHPNECEGCLMRDRCSGVFDSYVAR